MQWCIQPNPANPLEPWPHVNTFKLTRVDRNQSVYSSCHPSFGKTCVFALSSVQRLNKHSLAYATYYCFPEFVSTNHAQIRPRMWAGCRKFWGWLLMMWWRRLAQVAKQKTPFLLHLLCWGHCRSRLWMYTSQFNWCTLLAIAWQVVFHHHRRWAVEVIWDAGYFHQEFRVSGG